jgi:hypothetical protein
METGEVTGTWADDTSRVIAEVKAECAGWTEAARQANARRVLRLYGFNLPDDDSYAVPVSDHMKADIMVNWHYHGASGWSYGTDQGGHYYEMSPDGKLKRIYSLNERHEVTGYAQKFGPSKAARKFDIPQRTIRSWAERG